MEKLNKRLRNFRIKSKLTQQQVAEALDVTRQAVTKWESGDSLPSMSNLLALANLYHTSVEELTGIESKSFTDGKSDKNDFRNEELNEKKVFWTTAKNTVLIICLSILSLILYFSLLRPQSISMTACLAVQIPIYICSTILTSIMDKSTRRKKGFILLLLPFLITVCLQIIVGLVVEL